LRDEPERGPARPVTPSAHPPRERATLSRPLADFLIELSIALHKHAIYPEGHPSLSPAAAGLAERASLLLDERPSLSLGVARNQLVIEGLATDSRHPVLRELAGRLHRHHLGAVTFRRGVDGSEVASVLRTLAVDAERSGQPLGLGPPARLREWPHVELHPLTYERLELADDQGVARAEGGTRAAELWLGLARAALAAEASSEKPAPTEPAVIARAIDAHPGGDAAAYDQVIVGYLLQIAGELKVAGSAAAVALRRRTSRLIAALSPETLRRLIAMGGDFTQRRNFLYDATSGMAVDAVLEILKAAADTSHQTISHALVRMFSKLAAHAEHGAEAVRPQADAALREQTQQLLEGWTLADPVPGAYGAALARMSRSAGGFAGRRDGRHPPEPERILAMALELELVDAQVLEAADRVVAAGRLGALLDLLGKVPAENRAVAPVWERIATPDVVRELVRHEPIDFRTLERLVPRVGAGATAPLLEALAVAQSRGARRGLLAQLATLGPVVAPLVIARLDDTRWYVTRNLLALLDELPSLPPDFSPARYTNHADARVRREAVKLQLRVPAERDRALVAALGDADSRTVRLALTRALERCPEAAVPLLAARATDRTLTADLRVLALRALGTSPSRAALETLLRVCSAGRTLLGKAKLAPKSPELLVALSALASAWRGDSRARAILARAAAAADPEIRAATDPGRPA
jgi:hypothetical protein